MNDTKCVIYLWPRREITNSNPAGWDKIDFLYVITCVFLLKEIYSINIALWYRYLHFRIRKIRTSLNKGSLVCCNYPLLSQIHFP
jgi:hypothetical protein